MKQVFDLTNEKGSKQAQDWLGGLSFTDIATMALFGGPLGMLLRYGLSKASEPSRERQQAEALIEAGRRNGVAEMEIIVSKNTGVRLEGSIPQANVSVGGEIGASGNVHVKVRYK